ncbi:hypothetical protein G9Z57_000407 [Salmonella enterica]|uniref:Uncharacterized protein n=1 Tax=Salmonella enterica TaxID=28901 RepID=A0A762GN97_SALER|nr:hypothetical protein [Salmonella enterica]EFR1494953.1 hypothetical protein [Salmonella enterica subsp. enterica serovar Agama]EIB9770457.1 hypothetical protein [Salmonella enterica subsp. enterica serovar Limete]EFR8467339.1 hypothetical protein [Salmonella enterica subsp. enterica serovar Agama]EGG7760400.1 hypothetical protein [Salmonella enterica]
MDGQNLPAAFVQTDLACLSGSICFVIGSAKARKRATVLSSSLSYETAHECAISNGIMPNDNRILAEEVAWQEIEVPL